MKALLAFAVTVAVAGAPTWAQTTQQMPRHPSNTQNAPGEGGTSKPGVPGHAGTESGPSPSSGSSMPGAKDSGPSVTRQRDQSKVPGLPGGKSGASAPQGGSEGAAQ